MIANSEPLRYWAISLRDTYIQRANKGINALGPQQKLVENC